MKPTEEQQVLVVNSGYDLSAVEYERISGQLTCCRLSTLLVVYNVLHS